VWSRGQWSDLHLLPNTTFWFVQCHQQIHRRHRAANVFVAFFYRVWPNLFMHFLFPYFYSRVGISSPISIARTSDAKKNHTWGTPPRILIDDCIDFVAYYQCPCTLPRSSRQLQYQCWYFGGRLWGDQLQL
jgi:hypothetical protein